MEYVRIKAWNKRGLLPGILITILERLSFIQINVKKYSICLSFTSLSATIHWFCSNHFPWGLYGYSVKVAGITIFGKITPYISFRTVYIFL